MTRSSGVLDRYQVPAQSRFVEVPSIGGRAQVVVAGEGPPLPMVIGGAILAVVWAPLMAEHSCHTLDAIEIGPGPFVTRSMGSARAPRRRGRRVAP